MVTGKNSAENRLKMLSGEGSMRWRCAAVRRAPHRFSSLPWGLPSEFELWPVAAVSARAAASCCCWGGAAGCGLAGCLAGWLLVLLPATMDNGRPMRVPLVPFRQRRRRHHQGGTGN
jgi:hypothetical protein